MNIERGLLWGQEPAISQGVQANITKGPLTVSISANNGFYSNRWNWITGLASWTFNPRDTLTFSGGGSISSNPYINTSTSYANLVNTATPLTQNNSQIYDLMFTHTQGPFSITPYMQYTYTPSQPSIGIYSSAHMIAGAVLAKYSFTPTISVAARAEYESTSGGAPQCSTVDTGEDGPTTVCTPITNLLYGNGSNAFSITVTPTYQYKIFFARAEFSYTDIGNLTPGLGFGSANTFTEQYRAMLETGILF